MLKKPSKTNRYKIINGNIASKMGLWVESIDSNSVLIVEYINDKKEGKAKKYYANGEYEEFYYKNDKIDGTLSHYSRYRILTFSKVYRNGEIIHSMKYQNGKVIEEMIGSPKW